MKGFTSECSNKYRHKHLHPNKKKREEQNAVCRRCSSVLFVIYNRKKFVATNMQEIMELHS